MNYVISYPPNTKTVIYKKLNVKKIVILCPFCGKEHEHAPVDAFKPYLKAECGGGCYVLKYEPCEE